MVFIADLIACSTCFRHHYAHHQELESSIKFVAACGIWCFGFQVVSMVWSWGLCVRFAGCCVKQMFFIADLIACSTCFRHHYAHHQELESITQLVAACCIWCFGFQVVSIVWSWGLCVRFAQTANRKPNPQLHTIPRTWKPKHQIPQAATNCIILSSSWWWA